MTGQFDLGAKHLNCIKKTKELISEIDKSLPPDKSPKEVIKSYLSNSLGTLPSENEIYDDYLAMIVSLEEISKHDSLSAYILADQIIFREILKSYSNAKAENYLEEDETVSLLCMESGYSGLNDLQTRASKTDEGWHVEGTKLISNEQLYSDKFVIFARDEENKIRLFIIHEDNIKIVESEKTISSSRVAFNQVKLSHNFREDQNIAVISDKFENILAVARTLIAAISVGIGHSCLVRGIEVVKETKNSKGESVSSSQGIQFTLADMFSEIESARMLTYYSADSIDKGKTSIKTASMAKVKASEASSTVALETLNLFGNVGFIANSDFAPLIQRSVDSRVKGGTNRLQRAQIYEYMLTKK